MLLLDLCQDSPLHCESSSAKIMSGTIHAKFQHRLNLTKCHSKKYILHCFSFHWLLYHAFVSDIFINVLKLFFLVIHLVFKTMPYVYRVFYTCRPCYVMKHNQPIHGLHNLPLAGLAQFVVYKPESQCHTESLISNLSVKI